MRITKSMLLFLVATLFVFNADAGNKLKKTNVSQSIKVVSRHVVRGFFTGNSPCIEPSLNFQTGKVTIGVWGAYAFDASYSEVDFYVQYNTPLFQFSVTSLYNPRQDFENSDFFDFESEESVHFLDAIVKYKGCDKFPISIMTSVMFYGEYDRDVNNNQRYSTYIELGYSKFIGGKKVDWALGLTPFKGFYADETNVVNINMSVFDKIKFSEQFSLPISAGLSLNPVNERLLFNVSFTL
jgi:hypothetical protein